MTEDELFVAIGPGRRIDASPAGVLAAADRLALARVEEAQTFLGFRIRGASTDGQAKAMTTIEMKGTVERAEAEYEIALAALRRA